MGRNANLTMRGRSARALLGACLLGTGLSGMSAVALAVHTAAPAAAAGPDVTFTIDASAANRKPISPLIYGLNASPDANGQPGFGAELNKTMAQTLTDLGITFVRSGGDATTAFNWEINASNLGHDDCNANQAAGANGANSPPGGQIQPVIDMANAAGARTMVSLSLGDHVAADDGTGKPPATNSDGSCTGNGPTLTRDPTRFFDHLMTDPNGATATPNLTDGKVYENDYVAWLHAHDASTPLDVALDNEPDIWNSTHPNIYPNNLLWNALTDRNLQYAGMVKGIIPTASVTGPVMSDWIGQTDPEYRNADKASTDYTNLQAQHPGDRYLDVYLRAIHAAEASAGKRLIDKLDLHWYPATNGAKLAAAEMEQRPRSLWDHNYVEADYLTETPVANTGTGGAPINLIPRLQQEIAANDPNTALPIAITEWDYGDRTNDTGQPSTDTEIAGAIANADALGTFGRTGVAEAAFWPVNWYNGVPSGTEGESFAYGAFKAFRNYNGSGAKFGDTEISATSTDTQTTSAPEPSSVYASIDASNPNHMVIVAINKSTSARTAAIQLNSTFQTGAAKVFTITSAGGPNPQPAADLNSNVAPDQFTYTMPAQSVSIIVPTPAAAKPALVGTTPPVALTGRSYSYQFTATGTPAPTFTTDSTKLPNGLSLNGTTGVLSGTPTKTGTFSFPITATNSAGSAMATVQMTVNSPQAPTLTANPPGSNLFTTYSYTFTATGAPQPTITIDDPANLPPGLSLNGSSGALSGKPTALGSFTFTVRAANGVSPDATKTVTMVIAKLPAGAVLAWGDNAQGELGYGPGGTSTTPIAVPLPAGVTAIQVANGDNPNGQGFAFALGSDGHVYSWGDNTCGQLGRGTGADCNDAHDVPSPTPAAVIFPSGTPPVISISASAGAGYAVTSDHNLWAWGRDQNGELGDGMSATRANTQQPIAVPLGANQGKVAAVVGSAYAAFVLMTDQTVLAMGQGGEVGDGTMTQRDTPTPVLLNGAKVVKLAAGGNGGHALALTTTGAVLSWGANTKGQIGNGTQDTSPEGTNPVTTPVAVAFPSGTTITDIGAGDYSSYAITSTGAVFAWGDNSPHELGVDPNVGVETTPQAMKGAGGTSALPAMKQVEGGYFWTGALTADGHVFGLGANESGEIGDGTTKGEDWITPASIPAQQPIASVSAGALGMLALVGGSTTGGPAVSGTPSTVGTGKPLTLTWSGIASPTSTDWVGLFPSSAAANSAFVAWRYTTGAASGSVPLTVPSGLPSGSAYELRLFSHNAFTRLATSTPLTVQAAAVSATPTPIGTGNALSITWSNVVGPTANDWVGLYPSPSATDSAFVGWRYTTGAASGTVTFVVPAGIPTGSTYQVRLFTNNGFGRMATSSPLTVQAATVAESPNPVVHGQALTATWGNVLTPTTTDWVGLYSSSTAADIAFIAWTYTKANASGNVTLTVPASATAHGGYQLRLFTKNGFNRAATSAAFAVS